MALCSLSTGTISPTPPRMFGEPRETPPWAAHEPMARTAFGSAIWS